MPKRLKKIGLGIFEASAYRVKQRAATLQHRMMEIQPDPVVLAIISNDLNLGRTPLLTGQVI
jgi:hypothetical protein